MKARHSYVAFHTAKWIAGTMNMPRLMKAVYFDVCLFNWHHAEKVSDTELEIMLSDLPAAQAGGIIDALVRTHRLDRDEDGNVWSPKALDEAERARDLYEAKSRGGKKRQETGSTPAGEKQHSSKSHGADSDLESDLEQEVKKGGSKDPPKESRTDCEKVLRAWNEMAEQTGPVNEGGLSRASRLTDSRASVIAARIEEHGVDTIIASFATIPGNDFLMGRSGGHWKANLDDLMRPKNCAKLIEGGYAQGAGKRSSWR